MSLELALGRNEMTVLMHSRLAAYILEATRNSRTDLQNQQGKQNQQCNSHQVTLYIHGS